MIAGTRLALSVKEMLWKWYVLFGQLIGKETDKSLQHATPFFMSEMEASAFKAEKHRIMLVDRDFEDHLVQHPSSSRTKAST